MKVIVKFDGREYKGRDAGEVVRMLMAESHDLTPDLATYKRAVAARARVEFGDKGRIRTRSDWDFLKDLEKIGQFNVLKKILTP